jgi:hypothetical protein
MATTLLTTIGVLMALMAGWIEVQRAARRAAEQHPEAGPLRLIGGGCGGHGHGQENSGNEAAPVPKPLAKTAPAEGCATCVNTACKPGALAADEFRQFCSN